MSEFEDCAICGGRLDGAQAAVVVGSAHPIYQPFVEDWRGGLVTMAHPECFAREHGVAALIEAVAREDARRVGRPF